jgi:hypothetical protein
MVSRAIDLCDPALRMIEGGARGWRAGVKILLSQGGYESTMTSLGLIPEIADDSESDFAAAVRDSGGTTSDVPPPESAIARAFPWL